MNNKIDYKELAIKQNSLLKKILICLLQMEDMDFRISVSSTRTEQEKEFDVYRKWTRGYIDHLAKEIEYVLIKGKKWPTFDDLEIFMYWSKCGFRKLLSEHIFSVKDPSNFFQSQSLYVFNEWDEILKHLKPILTEWRERDKVLDKLRLK